MERRSLFLEWFALQNCRCVDKKINGKFQTRSRLLRSVKIAYDVCVCESLFDIGLNFKWCAWHSRFILINRCFRAYQNQHTCKVSLAHDVWHINLIKTNKQLIFAEQTIIIFQVRLIHSTYEWHTRTIFQMIPKKLRTLEARLQRNLLLFAIIYHLVWNPTFRLSNPVRTTKRSNSKQEKKITAISFLFKCFRIYCIYEKSYMKKLMNSEFWDEEIVWAFCVGICVAAQIIIIIAAHQ